MYVNALVKAETTVTLSIPIQAIGFVGNAEGRQSTCYGNARTAAKFTFPLNRPSIQRSFTSMFVGSVNHDFTT